MSHKGPPEPIASSVPGIHGLQLWTAAAIGGLLLAIATEGPDFGHYSDWAAAALSGDIFKLRGNVLSPGGVPFSLAAPGPGLLFAVGKLLMVPLTLGTAALVTGWIATLCFWACAFAVLRHVAGGDRKLAIVGAGGLFLGTHAGLYSHAYATEAFANALVAALWALALTRRRWRWLDSMMVGVLAGLLLLVRAYVVLYAIPALWVAVFGWRVPWAGDADRGEDSIRATARRATAVFIPCAIALAEYVFVNGWMTGAPLRPPYVYGGDGFTSIDMRHPEVAAVLLHPWHGLLAYHPLYGVAFVATAVEGWRDPPRRALWLATLAAVIAHVWVQAAWYIWWLGGSTFGMRGMAPAALPLVAGLVAAIRRDGLKQPDRVSVWVLAMLVACAWSFPLLVRGNTQFYAWRPFLASQQPALFAVIVSGGLWAFARYSGNSVMLRRRYDLIAAVLAVVVLGYLMSQLALFPGIGARLLHAAGGALLALSAVSAWRRLARSRAAVTSACIAAVFLAQAVLFGRLGVRTERYHASGAAPPRDFEYVGTAPVDELRVTYAEYLEVPGFAARKAQFRRFLMWQRIHSSRLSPSDRELADTVREQLLLDPRFGDRLVEVTARNGVLVITANGMTDSQQERVAELVRSIAAGAEVTFSAN